MKISDLIKNKLHISCESVNETEVETLGLNVSKPGKAFATFISDPKHLLLLNENVRVILTTRKIAETTDFTNLGACIVDSPREVFFKLHNALAFDSQYDRKKQKSVIEKNCRISESAHIASNNVWIGSNVVIEENVVIRENTIVQDDSIIRAGCVIGGEGYEFKNDNGMIYRVEHLGGVKIGRHVEIQYNTCVDKAIYPWDDTILGDEVKVDNLVHIAHAVKIGTGSYIVAGSLIGGRVEIGENAWIGLGAVLRNGITIGSHARANMGAVVTKSVADGEAVSGNFAIPHEELIRLVKRNK